MIVFDSRYIHVCSNLLVFVRAGTRDSEILWAQDSLEMIHTAEETVVNCVYVIVYFADFSSFVGIDWQFFSSCFLASSKLLQYVLWIAR